MKHFSPLNLVPLIRKPGDHTGRSLGNVLWGADDAQIAYARRSRVYFLAHELSHYDILLRKGRRLLKTFEQIGGVLFALGFLALGVFSVIEATSVIGFSVELFSLSQLPVQTRLYVALGLLALVYLFYLRHAFRTRHTVVEQRSFGEVYYQGIENTSPDLEHWQEFFAYKRADRVNITGTCTDDFLRVLDGAFSVAWHVKSTTIAPAHLLSSLLAEEKIRAIFLRLGVPPKTLQERVTSFMVKGPHRSEPILDESAASAVMAAYERAYELRQSYVHVTELLITTVQASTQLQDLLYDLGVDGHRLENATEWVRLQEQMRRDYHHFRKAAAKVSKHGMDRAMTAVATPFLNQFSRDLTLVGKYGGLKRAVARDEEIEQIMRVVDGGTQHVVLTGEHGVGKMSIVHGLVMRMIEGDVPKRLKDKRMVQISTSALLAGTTMAGAEERLIKIMSEINRARNVIVFIDNLQDLVGTSSGSGEEGLDVTEALAEYLQGASTMLFATATTTGYNQHISHSQIATMLTRVQIAEMDADQTVRVLETKVGRVEYDKKVFFSYDALEASAVLAGKYLYDQPLPGSALEVLTEAASVARAKKGEQSLVAKEHVAEVMSQKTGIPVTSIAEDESDKLLRLEDELHKRVVGQDEAVVLVANALRRARANIREDNRPIANFLFLGPTGVGKTELAKTIADVYFGGEDKMIRIDMSEFQDTQSVYRLIGMPGRQGTGILTEAVRQQPFSLVLLDELEKANTETLNLFLQVFDDGRLTDSVGRTVDFTNTIIIATSNAGTSYVSKHLAAGESLEVIRQNMIHGELRTSYRPEFLNRFDGIVLFRSLTRENIIKIAGFMLKRVERDLDERGVLFVVAPEALEDLADVGFDPEFGARPMRRAIQDKVENGIAELVLSKKLKRGVTVNLEAGLKIRIS